ncbi:TPM domain-containing protein [Oceaniferula spumae]
MQCPYCRTVLTETSKECPSCLLSLYTANSLLGPMPRTTRGFTDTIGILEKGADKKINRALNRLGRKFPQVNMHVLIGKFDTKFPIATHLFWLFNQGDLCADSSKGGKNHDILLGLDPKSGKIGLIVGYGLEPFLPAKALDHTLEKSQPSLAEANYTQAILTVIEAVSDLMEGICSGFNDTLGIDLEEKAVVKEF